MSDGTLAFFGLVAVSLFVGVIVVFGAPLRRRRGVATRPRGAAGTDMVGDWSFFSSDGGSSSDCAGSSDGGASCGGGDGGGGGD